MPCRSESDHGPMWGPAPSGEAGAMSYHDPASRMPAGAPAPDPTHDLVARDLVMTYGRSGASAAST